MSDNDNDPVAADPPEGAQLTTLPATQETSVATGTPWREIDVSPYERLPFPIEVLPEDLREFVESVADYARVLADAPALLALGAVGAAAANRFIVRVGREVHPVHVWILGMLLSGIGKTRVLERLSAPFQAAQASLREGSGGKQIARKVDRRIAEAERNRLHRRLQHLLPGNPDVAAERDSIRSTLLQLEGEIESLRDLPEPTLLSDDVTIPALVQLMAAEGGPVALLSAEGSTFFRAINAAAGSEPIEPALQAYSAEPIRVHRVSRPAISIERPALSLMLGTQPTVVRGLFRTGGFAGRGLWERFLFVEPEPREGSTDGGGGDPSGLACGMYASLIRSLLARSIHAPTELRLSDDALQLLQTYSEEVASRFGDGDLSEEFIQGWAYKIRGNVIRLAAILHIAENSDEQQRISRKSLEGAIAVMAMCITHARHVLAAGDSPTDTRAVIGWLQQRRLASVTVRDLERGLQRVFHEAKFLRDALTELEVLGLVRIETRQRERGRPSDLVTLHPALRRPRVGRPGGR